MCKIGSPLLSFLLCSLCTPLQDKAKGKIKRIKIIGTNDAGSFEVDTNITGMKHFLKVKGESVTNEVESSDFFVKAQEFIASMGGRI